MQKILKGLFDVEESFAKEALRIICDKYRH